MNTPCTVRELLELPPLCQKAAVVAGEAYLDRPVNWVHILEVCDNISEPLDGNEMILTTGVGLVTEELTRAFLKRLIDCGCACLCIETASQHLSITPWMQEFAQANQFPLLELDGIVRFLDITRACNSFIIQNETPHMDIFQRKLAELNDEAGLEAILDFTSNYLNVNVAYQPVSGKLYSTNAKQFRTLKNIESIGETQDEGLPPSRHLLSTNIMFWDRFTGVLFLFSQERVLSADHALYLSQLANRVIQHLKTDILAEEMHLSRQTDWIHDWLSGNLDEAMIRNHLSLQGIVYRKTRCLCCVAKIIQNDLFPIQESKILENFSNQAIKAAEGDFRNAGLSMLGRVEGDSMIFCVICPASLPDIESRTERVIHELQSRRNECSNSVNCRFAIGPVVDRYEDICKSLHKAHRTMRILIRKNETIGLCNQMFGTLVFDTLDNDGLLCEYAEDVLSPILLPENRDLLYTLLIFYDCNCNKQKTAEKLYIARQTMYFRLQKIQDILGEDFALGEKRFGLELAVRAYHYLFPIDK